MPIYLIHFDRKYHHAQHYLGYAKDVPARADRHWNGNGSKLLRAVQEAGIGWEVVKVWEGDRKVERKMHKMKSNPKLCPKCNPGSNQGKKHAKNSSELT